MMTLIEKNAAIFTSCPIFPPTLRMVMGQFGAKYDNTIPVPTPHPGPRPRSYPRPQGLSP